MTWGMYMKADFEVADPDKYQKAVQEAAGLCPQRAISIDSMDLHETSHEREKNPSIVLNLLFKEASS